MKKGIMLGLALALTFVGVPVLACSSHSIAAEGMVENWLGNGAAANNGVGGSDTNTDGGAFNGLVNITAGNSAADNGGSFHRDNYWLTITGPNGFSFTFNAVTSADRSTVTVQDRYGNPVTIHDGASLEAFLRDQTIAIIRSLLPDAQGSDYVG